MFDSIDTINRQSTITYSLTQRILQKELQSGDNFNTREVLRFDISQTMDLIEAIRLDASWSKFLERYGSCLPWLIGKELFIFGQIPVGASKELYLQARS